MDYTPRWIKILDALSQLVLMIIVRDHTTTTANESISGHSYRLGHKRWIRFVDRHLGEGHCQRSHENDVERARQLLKCSCPSQEM